MIGTLHHRLDNQPFLFLHHPWPGNERLLVSQYAISKLEQDSVLSRRGKGEAFVLVFKKRGKLSARP